jgi:D-arabinose 1-dehydrogenase-like Zn-dependent alcohol dehydrogenase
MRMFQLCVCGEPLQYTEQPTPEPKGTEVLLKVLAAGVCHSDLHLADGWFDLGGGKRLSLAERGMKLPVTLGHENVGEVVAIGPDAKDAKGLRIGARMLANPWIGCGTCGPCRRGDENLCRAMKSLGVFANGGYADYVMVPHPRYLSDIGDLPADRVAPLACSGVPTPGPFLCPEQSAIGCVSTTKIECLCRKPHPIPTRKSATKSIAKLPLASCGGPMARILLKAARTMKNWWMCCANCHHSGR